MDLPGHRRVNAADNPASLISPINTFAMVYNVKVLVTKTGESVLITELLQSLIDKCSAEGGGGVHFPARLRLSKKLSPASGSVTRPSSS